MALISCYECNKEISEKALSCPNCGAPKDIKTFNTTNNSLSEKPSVIKIFFLRLLQSRLLRYIIIFIIGFKLLIFIGESLAKGSPELAAIFILIPLSVLGLIFFYNAKSILTEWFYMFRGNRYNGEWKSGKKHGKGVFILHDGQTKHVGEWANGRMNGKGTLTWANGDKYKGEFKDNQYHGEGVLTTFEGEYVGEFMHNQKNGSGVFTFPDGTTFEGLWENDKFTENE